MEDTGARIYNLFPRLVGSFDHWPPHLIRAAEMDFDWIYVNPLYYPGFSGSLYSVKDYYKINPIFLNAGSSKNEFSQLKEAISFAAGIGLKMMLDLVINHTAIDCVLISQHPAWYKWEKGKIVNPSCMDPADARKITVWGDLAEIDNFYSDDRESLWNYWGQLSLFYARLGFGGFRCDAAYQVPVELWKRLIKKIKSLYPDFIFVAETLGCKEKDLLALAEAGFDYLYNSSKWWDFKAEWCLRQYNESRLYAPSIAFPETHDSARLAEETGADINYLKMRYLFAATFSKGLLVPIGFEFGFKRKMNVVKTSPEWWEASNFDLTDFIRQVNNFKKKYQIFNADNPTFQLECLKDEPICGLIKISPASGEKAILLINPQQTKSQPVRLPNLPEIFQASGPFQIISPQEAPVSIGQSFETSLNPSEIKIIYSKMGTDPNF